MMINTRLNRLGGAAGIAYVAVSATAAALTGAPPGFGADSHAFQQFFSDHRGLILAQSWLYALATVLVIWFAVAVRRLLYAAPASRHLGELFFVATVAIATLTFVSMSIRIVAARWAKELSGAAVRAVGNDFSLVLLALCGFLVALSAFGYLGCVISTQVLPHWTGWLAGFAGVVNLAATASVFISRGPFSIEGQFATLVPAVATGVWYLGTSFSLLRARGGAETDVPERR